MALSQQLRNISSSIREATEGQQSAQESALGVQTQQAIGQSRGKQAAQQLAGGITQGQQQAVTGAMQSQQGQLTQLAQQGIQQQGAARQQKLGEQQLLNDTQISDLQRQGQLRQNSEALRQSKELQTNELEQQKRLTGAKIDYDNSLSFLTRKQREDLSNVSEYTKQMLFDQRLMFEKDEQGRKFSNLQQLADYAVLSSRKDEDLQMKLQDMQQATELEVNALQHAHDMITSKMKLEFDRAEKTKDYALLKKLSGMKSALQEKMNRKSAKAGMISNVIIGGATIVGAVYGGPAGAAAAGAGAQAATGVAQSQGAY